MLIADPQVLDHRSYPGRHPLLMALSQRVVDLYLRKSWWATLRLRPDVIIFLGDMMDGGRFAMSDAECACPCPNITASDALNEQVRRHYGRFSSIFAVDKDIPVYYIPGNHDVG